LEKHAPALDAVQPNTTTAEGPSNVSASTAGDPQPHGRLELTWTNKDLRLLATEDGSYEWVRPSDFRVAEVHLLHEVERVGELDPSGVDNLLIRGDALNGLTSVFELPEFRSHYAGKIQLAYLDPPFNRQVAFEHYPDALEHSVWLTMMRDRLRQIRSLLSPTGSVWVHCDDSEQAYLKVLMDEVFLRPNFVAAIIWQKRYSRDNRPAIGTVHDYILVYSPMGGDWKHVRNRIAREDKRVRAQYRNPNNDPRGRWRPIPMDAQGFRQNQMYEVVTPAGVVHRPPKGRCWSMLEERYLELRSQGGIYFGKDGRGRPNVIRYLDEDEGLVPWTWWPSEEVGHTDEAKKEILALFPDVEPFDTPKPERLMHRIIQIATKPNEVVLDCFAGSGTTAAVAQKMGRRWITMEMLPTVLDTFALPRLRRVVVGDEPGGVTETTDWKGGGGFRVLQIGPSMFERVDGATLLADWTVGGALQEATAAQIGYAYEPNPPFCGRKGRTRLAVIDGLANGNVIGLLAERLEERENLLVYATAIDPSAHAATAELRGARVRRIPSAILASYARARVPVAAERGAAS
jgi:adenine-specific DNA-methyltransferase